MSAELKNSLMNRPKWQLATDHETLVFMLMKLWCVRHRMEDWRDPITAVQQMEQEARA